MQSRPDITMAARLKTVPARIGLIAGEGNFPLLLAEAARNEGVEIIAFGVHGLANEELRRHSIAMHSLKLTEFSKLFDFCRQYDVRHVVMAGRVPHSILLKQISFDPRIFKVLGGLANRKADTLLSAAVEEIEKEGIEVLDSTMFLSSCMPDPGLLTPRMRPTEEIMKDIEFGWPLAREAGRLDIGQTVAVKNGVVIAVEALEGTDGLIKRTYPLAGEGCVFVKVAKPRQDMRFDVPVIGLTTIRNLAAARAAALCVQAGRTLFFDRKEAIELAEQNRIAIIARAEDEPITAAMWR
jgi:DUF1009 family protein